MTTYLPMLKQKPLAVVGLVMLSLLGIGCTLILTPSGIGTSPDSIAYIRAARNLLEGHGLNITHHAPLYAVMLAAGGSLGIDPFDAARWLNALFFGANILLVGLIVAGFTRASAWIPIIGSFLVLSALPMLTIHLMAWTESVFIFFTFLGIFLLALYLEKSGRWFLIAAALLLGLALLVRYAGAAVIITGFTGLLLFNQKTIFRRLVAALMFGFISAMPMFLWLINNLWVSGTSTNREMFFHPITLAQIREAFYTLSRWLLLPDTAANALRLGVWLILVIVLGGGLILLRRQAKGGTNQPGSPVSTKTPAIIKILALFLLVYSTFLVVSISLFDANTPLDDRILSPVYISALILGLYLLDQLLVLTGNTIAARAALLGCLVVFSAATLLNSLFSIRAGYPQNLGFSSPIWRQSETLALVKRLPAEAVIFSNSPEAIYLYTNRPVQPLPKKFLSANQQLNASYAADLSSMQGQIENQRGVLVYFNTLPERSTLPTAEELKAQLSLCVVAQAADGAIYGINACPQ